MRFDFDKAFVAELEARGVTFESTGDGFYRVVRDGHAVQINTQNIRAEALRDDDPSAIGWFLDVALDGLPALPPWPHARVTDRVNGATHDRRYGASWRVLIRASNGVSGCGGFGGLRKRRFGA
jgi:hypothetical protein